MGVKGWGCAKDVILWELGIRRRLNRKIGLTMGTDTHPRVFFVPFAAALGKRVADKGLMLDAESSASTFGELNAETRSAQRLEDEGTDLDGSARLGRNMENDSRSSYRLSIVFLITELVFERDRRKLMEFKGLNEG